MTDLPSPREALGLPPDGAVRVDDLYAALRHRALTLRTLRSPGEPPRYQVSRRHQESPHEPVSSLVAAMMEACYILHPDVEEWAPEPERPARAPRSSATERMSRRRERLAQEFPDVLPPPPNETPEEAAHRVAWQLRNAERRRDSLARGLDCREEPAEEAESREELAKEEIDE